MVPGGRKEKGMVVQNWGQEGTRNVKQVDLCLRK